MTRIEWIFTDQKAEYGFYPFNPCSPPFYKKVLKVSNCVVFWQPVYDPILFYCWLATD